MLDEHVIVLGRQLDDRVAISATNNAEQPRTVTIELPENCHVTSFTDATTGTSIQAIKGHLTFNIPALFGTLLLSP
jgi:hypothetical protein